MEPSKAAIEASIEILKYLVNRPSVVWSAMHEGYDVAVLIEKAIQKAQPREESI